MPRAAQLLLEHESATTENASPTLSQTLEQPWSMHSNGNPLGLELAACGLAAVGQQVVGLAEGLRLHYEVARDLIALPRQPPSLF